MNLTSHGSQSATVITPTEDQVSWMTTEAPFTSEEEDAIVTVVVVIIGIILAIIVLFSMGVFIDCKHQEHTLIKKKKKTLRLKLPPLSRRKNHENDEKSLASDMCPTGTSDLKAGTRDAVLSVLP